MEAHERRMSYRAVTPVHDQILVVGPYRVSDREAVCRFAADDVLERLRLAAGYPRIGMFRADDLGHFHDREPEGCFVAVANGELIENPLGAVYSSVAEDRENTCTCRRSCTLFRGATHRSEESMASATR